MASGQLENQKNLQSGGGIAKSEPLPIMIAQYLLRDRS